MWREREKDYLASAWRPSHRVLEVIKLQDPFGTIGFSIPHLYSRARVPLTCLTACARRGEALAAARSVWKPIARARCRRARVETWMAADVKENCAISPLRTDTARLCWLLFLCGHRRGIYIYTYISNAPAAHSAFTRNCGMLWCGCCVKKKRLFGKRGVADVWGFALAPESRTGRYIFSFILTCGDCKNKIIIIILLSKMFCKNCCKICCCW